MPRWVYPLAFFFVLFLIFTQPSNAGAAASGFASFGGQALESTGEFLGGLFGESENSTGVRTNGNVVEGGQDIVTHTHDGLAPHSHGPTE